MQAYLSSLDFTVAVIVGAFVFAMIALGLNNADAFWRARSLRGKLLVPAATVNRAMDTDTGARGVTIAPLFHNTSLHTIAVVIETLEFSIGDIKSRENIKGYPTKEFFVSPGIPNGFKSGLVPIELDSSDQEKFHKGKLHVIFRYGRPGAPRIYDEFEAELNIGFNDRGELYGDLFRKVSGGE